MAVRHPLILCPFCLQRAYIYVYLCSMMRQVEQTTLFDMPPMEAKPVKRRKRVTGEAVCTPPQNRSERLEQRNRLIVLRYHYWCEIVRRRTDDVIAILSAREFFVEERTIWNAILAQGDYLKELNEVCALRSATCVRSILVLSGRGFCFLYKIV